MISGNEREEKMQLVRIARAVASGSGGSQLNVASLSAGYGRENHNIPANCICEKKRKTTPAARKLHCSCENELPQKME